MVTTQKEGKWEKLLIQSWIGSQPPSFACAGPRPGWEWKKEGSEWVERLEDVLAAGCCK